MALSDADVQKQVKKCLNNKKRKQFQEKILKSCSRDQKKLNLRFELA